MRALILPAPASLPVRPSSERPLARNLQWLSHYGVRDVGFGTSVAGDHEQAERSAIENIPTRFGITLRYLPDATARHDFVQDSPCLVLADDRVYSFDLNRMITEHDRCPGPASVAVLTIGVHAGCETLPDKRVEMDRSGRILRFASAERSPNLPHVNAGCYILDPEVMLGWTSAALFEPTADLLTPLLRAPRILCAHRIEAGGSVVVVRPAHAVTT